MQEGVALGLQLLKGTHLVPKVERIFDIVCGLIYLLDIGRTSQKHIATFFGKLQWTLLINRPMLSCCHHAYSFLDADSDIIVDIPDKALRELGLITTLMFGTAVDLRADWSLFVWATGGAESFGYGSTCALCLPDVTRYLASFVHIDGHQIVPTDMFDRHSVKHVCAVEMPLRYRDF